MKHLLDACVLSEARKKQTHPNLVRWLKCLEEVRLFVSVIFIVGIREGCAKFNDSANRKKLYVWLE